MPAITGMGAQSNFEFLKEHDDRLARLGALAERYFAEDPPASLIKLRQLGEFLAKEVAASHVSLPAPAASFDEVLRVLKAKAILPPEVAGMFYHLKQAGNAAVHEDRGSPGDVLQGLKIARSAAVWFHQTYGNAPHFKAGPFRSCILACAFRGELVPQDPNDEPATVLFNRIRAHRAATPKGKRRRKKTEEAAA